MALYFLADRGKYRKDEIVSVEVQGDFCHIPGICRKLECSECDIAKGRKEHPPICDPCNYLGEATA